MQTGLSNIQKAGNIRTYKGHMALKHHTFSEGLSLLNLTQCLSIYFVKRLSEEAFLSSCHGVAMETCNATD